MVSSKAGQGLLLGKLTLLALLAWPTQAKAEEVFVGALQTAANMPCTPTCLVCHTTNPGVAGTWVSKKLPVTLQSLGKLQKGSTEANLQAAFALYAMDPNNAASIKALQNGEDPEHPGVSVCGPTYGCGASIANTSAATRLSPTGAICGALSVALGLLLLRRRR